MTSDLTEKRCERLADQGYQHLEDGKPDEALAVAAKLEELEYTAAFEIAALAHAQQGDLATAVKTLERGLDLEPAVWVNWQLLGNYLSDLGRHDEAASAYERALGCPGVELSSIRLNQAVLAHRRDDLPRVLECVRQVEDPALASRAAAVEVDALRRAGRLDEAVQVGETALAASEAKVGDPDELASLAESVGRARWQGGASPTEVIAFALESLEVLAGPNGDPKGVYARSVRHYYERDE
jgi:tetratricopeptide (TPR) repeat protein